MLCLIDHRLARIVVSLHYLGFLVFLGAAHDDLSRIPKLLWMSKRSCSDLKLAVDASDSSLVSNQIKHKCRFVACTLFIPNLSIGDQGTLQTRCRRQYACVLIVVGLACLIMSQPRLQVLTLLSLLP